MRDGYKCRDRRKQKIIKFRADKMGRRWIRYFKHRIQLLVTSARGLQIILGVDALRQARNIPRLGDTGTRCARGLDHNMRLSCAKCFRRLPARVELALWPSIFVRRLVSAKVWSKTSQSQQAAYVAIVIDVVFSTLCVQSTRRSRSLWEPVRLRRMNCRSVICRCLTLDNCGLPRHLAPRFPREIETRQSGHQFAADRTPVLR
jgi:hypothetical protein